MKYLLGLFILILTGCGVNPNSSELQYPVDIPASFGQTVSRTYPVYGARSCIFTLYNSQGKEYPYQSYGYACEYNENGYVKNVTVEYYYTLPNLGYLSYNY